MKTLSNQTLLSAVWQTPLGRMNGEFSACGLRTLHFPPVTQQTLNDAVDGTLRGEVALLEAAWHGPADEAAENSSRQACAALTRWLGDFFSGKPRPCPIELDWAGASDFDRRVWQETLAIAPGQTRTYGQIALALGQPGAARAVGGALGRNPLVLLVPCHRVLSSAGGARRLCGFTGGLPLKRALLDLEADHFATAPRQQQPTHATLFG